MDDRLLIAHLLRRTGFGPLPGQVEALAPGGYRGALEGVLEAAPLAPFAAPAQSDDDIALSWLRQMRNPGAGLHEKMVWYWHGHFTSSADAVGDGGRLYRQQLLLRTHALGNFRELVRAITVDAAMLEYLNGDGSVADAPNENYARELMELFTLGRGSYTQADVRSGARGLAGWSVTEGGVVGFDSAAANHAQLTFLGRTGELGVDDICAAVCEHSACAPFVAGRIHRFLIGTEPSPARRAELADLFRRSGLEIRPLVEAILRHPDFATLRHSRPRFPVEWGTAAQAALGVDTDRSIFEALAQVPFQPPNVAGWPPGPRWLSATAALARAGLALTASPLAEIAAAADPVDAALQRCALYEVGDRTRAALRSAAAGLGDPDQRATVLLGLALVAPEFALA